MKNVSTIRAQCFFFFRWFFSLPFTLNLWFFFFIRSRFCFTFHSEPIIINHIIWIFIKQWLENGSTNWNIIFMNPLICLTWCILHFAFIFPWILILNDCLMIWFVLIRVIVAQDALSTPFQLRIDTNETRNAIISKRFNNETVNAVVRAFVMNVFGFMQFYTQRTIQTGWRNVCVLRLDGDKWH